MNSQFISMLSDLRSVTIECDKPYLDGYGPANLLSSDSKGFTAERFIRPPITLTVKFPCPVKLQSILINNTRGSFSSTGFEIRANSSQLEGYEMPVYKPIGKAFDCTPGVVKFINQRFQRKPANRPAGGTISNEYNLFSHDRVLLYRCRSITITITRALNSLPAVIGDLSIYGIPVDPSFVKTPKQMMTTQLNQLPVPMSHEVASSTLERFTGDSIVKTSPAQETPEEFNDALTHNLMSYPITLPSGKVVDQTSLDKIFSSACALGCHAVDPFTGVKFSETYKPLANHLLRERIHRYASLNNITSIGRTIGTKRKYPTSLVSANFKVSRIQREGDILKASKEKTNVTLSRMDQRIQSLLNRSSKLRTVALESEATVPICKQCLKVGKKQETATPLYTLRCNHLICKDCALKESKFVTCNECSRRTAMCDLKVFRSTL